MAEEKEVEEEKVDKTQEGPINKTFTFSKDRPLSYEQKSSTKGSKMVYTIVGLLIIVIASVGLFFRSKVKNLVSSVNPTPVPTVVVTTESVPTPNPLVRFDWSFEVLNGSGEAGLAKTMAGKIQNLGYQVVKTGNADKSNYPQTEILVKKDLLDKVDLVIADLKDVIKIASVAGGLKDSTASARIIIGKD